MNAFASPAMLPANKTSFSAEEWQQLLASPMVSYQPWQ